MNTGFPPKAEGCFPTPGSIPEVVTEGFKYVEAVPIEKGILFQWGYPGVGFGEVTIWLAPDGQWHADTECMGPGFCSKMLEFWIREIVSVQTSLSEEEE